MPGDLISADIGVQWKICGEGNAQGGSLEAQPKHAIITQTRTATTIVHASGDVECSIGTFDSVAKGIPVAATAGSPSANAPRVQVDSSYSGRIFYRQTWGFPFPKPRGDPASRDSGCRSLPEFFP